MFIGSFVTIDPLAKLIAFIIVPAHKQMVFVAGANIVAAVFIWIIISIVSGWAIKTDFVQTALKDMTEAMNEGKLLSELRGMNGDEL